MTCPWEDCGQPLVGLGRFCTACSRYTDDYEPEGGKQSRTVAAREGAIELGITIALKARGFAVWKLSQPRATKQTPGIADLFVTGSGVCAWVEVKSATGKQRREQMAFQHAVQANGGLYLLWRSSEDARAWCDHLDRRSA